MSADFTPFPKMARLRREVIVTEKIDGTNACIYIAPDTFARAYAIDAWTDDNGERMVMLAGSRTRWIKPGDDNFGFAAWAAEHAAELRALGPGQHFGEWWGRGIQRKYGLEERRFSLFNVLRWCAHDAEPESIPTGDPRIVKVQQRVPACVSLVPILDRGVFSTKHVESALDDLRTNGSRAAPGFMNPEGIVAFHVAGGVGFKQTCEKDDEFKSKAA